MLTVSEGGLSGVPTIYRYCYDTNKSETLYALEFAVNLPINLTLTIGSALNRPPYIIEDAESGLEIDIIKAAFKEIGQSVNFKFYSRKCQVLYFNKDRLDAVMTMSTLNGIRGYWSESYIEYDNVAISLASRQLKINSIAQLQHYT